MLPVNTAFNTAFPPPHSLDAAQAVHRWQTDTQHGLSTTVAQERLAHYGANRLLEAQPRPAWRKFLDQFHNLLVIILLLAAFLAWLIGDVKDSVVILLVVLFNATLGFYQEYRAEQTLAALKQMLAAHAKVKRDGHVQLLDATQLVPGDIVLLEAGERVPADGRLLAAHGLEVEEAALTGESQPVAKSTDTLSSADLPLAERTNLLFMNTVVTRGRAELLVTATGMATEMGKLAGMLASTTETATPLQQQLDTLGKKLALIASGVVALIFTLDMLRGLEVVQAAMTAVALAVAAIPEGLPAVVTVTLALGMWRMAQQQAIVKKLAAVETLGATQVICTDKTGTLTLNQMTARALWFAGEYFSVSGEGYHPNGTIQACNSIPQRDLRPLLLPLALCNEARVRDGKLIGAPTEGALWVLAQKGGLDPHALQQQYPRLAEIPFDSAHKFMATFHQTPQGVQMYIKGAPDVLLARAALDTAHYSQLESANQHLAEQAMRVLAVAHRTIPTAAFDPQGDLLQWAQDWEILGLIGLIDPPRPEAKRAIAACQQAGVQVKMITGDHPLTAAAIAQELGLPGRVISGAELDQLDDAALAAQIDAIGVFARVSPSHKVRLVAVLRQRGYITAMTGDGVNDAPALKAADIGVAMGITGTAVTKEAATLVLTDDNFATIVKAIKEGRVIYENIIKFVRFQLSTNIGAILTVLVATLLGMPAPFTAIQLLWVNIIMDGPPAMTLGVEPARAGIMHEPPRTQGAQILTLPRLGRLLLYGMTMMVGTLWVYAYALESHSPAYALTLAFTTFVLFQVFNALNARAEHESVFNRQFFQNSKFWLALVAVVLLQVVVVHWAVAQQIFTTVALQFNDWVLATLVAASVLILDEARKALTSIYSS